MDLDLDLIWIRLDFGWIWLDLGWIRFDFGWIRRQAPWPGDSRYSSPGIPRNSYDFLDSLEFYEAF